MQFIEKFRGQLRALLNFNSSIPVCCPMPWRMDSFFMVQIASLAHWTHFPLWTALCKITDAPENVSPASYNIVILYGMLDCIMFNITKAILYFFLYFTVSFSFLSASFINLSLNWIYFWSCMGESGLSHSWLFKQQPSLPQSASSLPDTLTLLASCSCPQSSSEAMLSLFHLFIQCSSCHDPVTLPEMCGHGLETQQDFSECSFWLWQWGKKKFTHGMGFKKICKTCSNKL